jgi:hypothetical protein
LRGLGTGLALVLALLALSIGQEEAAAADLATRLDEPGVRAGEFVFGKEASQGPEEWYLGVFRMRLRIPPAGPTGSFDLGASVDGFSSNYVGGKVIRGGRCGGRGLVLESLDLLRGDWREVRCGASVELTSRNFIQDRAVRPGRAIYKIDAEDLSRLGIEATILSSGIRSTPRGPGRLTIKAGEDEGRLSAGSWERVPVALVNFGDRPLRRLESRVSVEGASARPELAAVPAELPAHSRRLGYLWINAPQRGSYRVTVTASSNSNSPAAEFELAVGPRERSSLAETLRLIALICAALAAAGFFAHRVLSRRAGGSGPGA